MTIETAVLLAAGRGTRLGTLTDAIPKPLLEVGGRPIIVRIVEGLIRAGIRRFAVVTGYRAEQIEYELGNGAQAGVSMTYFRQAEPDGTARALALARPLLGEQQFFFGWGDILVRPENYRAVIKAGRLADAAIAVNEMDDLSAGGAVYLDGAGLVTRLVEKPAPGTSATRWNNAGFGVLGPEAWPFIDALQPSPRGEYELPAAIDAMAEAGLRIRAVPIEGPWFDIGTPESLAAARAEFTR
jgi:UDP-N-acetylglucosamine diphosphorylase / glucose-1-phosphate thymidylyltransferase / UDP-N-acetylgalactosamine diphosphorylase / glucosamine-1-phosphate N-acetyltransferase / galactosamine-1-phosphate N-acetyltransferase